MLKRESCGPFFSRYEAGVASLIKLAYINCSIQKLLFDGLLPVPDLMLPTSALFRTHALIFVTLVT